MSLNPAQRRVLREWMRSKAIVVCPCCGQDAWRSVEATYVRALFDAETIGIRGLRAEGREP